MIFKVESCWSGNNHFYFSIEPLTPRRGTDHIRVDAGSWTRQTAKTALDEVSRYYGVPRKNIRWSHR